MNPIEIALYLLLLGMLAFLAYVIFDDNTPRFP